MFHPGDIVVLKEPDIGEEAVAICRDATMRRTLSDSFKSHGKHRCF